MVSGTAYGVVLNDRVERARLADAFTQAPYNDPPRAPVVYIKPRNCLLDGGGVVTIPKDLVEVEIGATLALILGRDIGSGEGDLLGAIAAACLAIDLCTPGADYYRPAIRERCRDGFLPLGRQVGFTPTLEKFEITTLIDGVAVHRWNGERLMRSIPALIEDLAQFMTLRAGDLLLVGIPGDAALARAGQSIEVTAPGIPTLRCVLASEVSV